jgi:hypothetical protein
MDFFQHTLGLPNSFGAANVGALVFLVGLWVTFRRDGEKLAFLVAPAALCLLAACLKKYPFDGRLLLFLAPSALLLMGPGAARLAGPCRRRFFRATGLVLVTCLYVPTAYDAVRSALPPYGKEEIRPVLQYIRAHEQPGDLVYVHWGAGPAFRYYHDYRGYEFEQWKAGICSDWNKPRYVEELDNLAHDDNVRRIWFLISHDRSHERAFFLETLDGMGTRADAFQTRGASAYLYELRGRKVIRRDDEPGRPSSGDGMQH